MEDIAADVTIEELSPVKKKLSFDIPWAEVKRELDRAYDLVGRKAKIKGFRPGKVPRKVLEIHYREDAEGEAMTNLVSRSYEDAVKKHDLPVIAQPEIDQEGIEADRNFTYTATVEVRPEVEPVGYTGLSVTKEEIDLSEEDVDNRINQMREMYATLESVAEPRECALGDTLVIDFEVTVEGELRQELASENYSIEIGGGKFIPGFEEQLIGMKKGEEKTVGLTFPADYQPEELAGKEGFFKVTLKDLQEKIIPPLDDEFVKNFDVFETMDDLREAVRKSILDETSRKTEADFRKNIIDALLEKNDLEVPSMWVDHQTYQLMMDAQRRMMSSGLGGEKASELTWSMRDTFTPHAERMVKSALLLGRIAEKEEITVEDSDLEARIADLATMHGQTLEQVQEVFQADQARDRLRDELLEDKTIAFLVEKAEVSVVKKTFAELSEETP